MRLCLVLAGALLPGAAHALEVLKAGGVRLLAGGEASASVARRDGAGFNELDYGFNSLRMVRLRLQGELQLGGRLSVLSELRHTNDDRPRIYALYLRAKPWRGGPLDLQAGRIPPVFGAYPRRAYAADNVFIGEPLAYHYRTALPTTAKDAYGYDGGSYASGSGVPLASSQRWDTGFSAHISSGDWEAAASVTQGSLCNPRVRDDNAGKGVAARMAWRPAAGWILGASAAWGRYLEETLEHELGAGARAQRALGADVEYSRGHWLLRGEAIWSSWDSPLPGRPADALTAWGAWLETRYKLAPGLSTGLRVDRLTFGDRMMAPSAYYAAPRAPWDAGVTRLELGALVSLHRQVLLKTALQHDRREDDTNESFVAGQIVLWF